MTPFLRAVLAERVKEEKVRMQPFMMMLLKKQKHRSGPINQPPILYAFPQMSQIWRMLNNNI